MAKGGFNINIQSISFDGVPDVQALLDKTFPNLHLKVGIDIADGQFEKIKTQLGEIQSGFQNIPTGNISEGMDKTLASAQELRNAKGDIIGKTQTWNKGLGVTEQTTQKISKKTKELEHATTRTTTNYQKQATTVKQLALFQEKMARNIEGLSMRFDAQDINTRQVAELRKEMSRLTAESFTPETKARIQNMFDRITHGAKMSAVETRRASVEMQKYLKQHSIIQKQTIHQAMAPMFEETGQKAKESARVFEQHFKEVEKGTNSYGHMGKRVAELNGVTEQLKTTTKGLGMEILDAGRKFAQWWIIAQILMTPIRAFRDAIADIRELDTALTELRKVSAATMQEMREFAVVAGEIGIRMGASAQEVTKATVEFARLGMTIEEASMMAEKSILLGTVGAMNVEDASKALISTTKAFGVEIDKQGRNVERVIDNINEVGNNFAISQEDIAEALRRSSSAMVAAGNTMEETIALIVAPQEILQDARVVGTALRTVSMRLRGISEEGEDLKDLIPTLEKKFQRVGITLKKSDNELKSTIDTMRALHDVWEDISDMERADLLEAVAGRFCPVV